MSANLDRHAPLDSVTDCTLAKADTAVPELAAIMRRQAVGRTQPEFLVGIVEHIDRACLGVGELGRLGDDGGQARFRGRASNSPPG